MIYQIMPFPVTLNNANRVFKVMPFFDAEYLTNGYRYGHPLRSTRSSSVVTLSRPPTISSLKITDCSFRYASPRLWNQLPDSFRQLRQSCLDSPPHVSSSLLSSPLSSSITPSLFHSRLKTYLSTNPSHLRFLLPTGLPSSQRDWTGPCSSFYF